MGPLTGRTVVNSADTPGVKHLSVFSYKTSKHLCFIVSSNFKKPLYAVHLALMKVRLSLRTVVLSPLPAYSFPVAAVTNHHKLSDFTATQIYCFSVLEV